MREADKIEKLIRDKLKNKEFQRNEVIGVFKVLDIIKQYKKDNARPIEGVSEEEINKRIMEMFLPTDRDIQFKNKTYNDVKKRGGIY